MAAAMAAMLGLGCGPASPTPRHEQAEPSSANAEDTRPPKTSQPTPVAQWEPPTPPMQTRAWDAKQSEFPPEFSASVADIFDLGLADPRGCEYRVVKRAPVAGVDLSALPELHAFVLPADDNAERFAVTWRGLVTRIHSVGSPADLVGDMQLLGRARGPNRGVFDREPHRSQLYAIGEGEPLVLKAALLLRLGHSNLAKTLWDLARISVDRSTLAKHQADPYFVISQAWLRAAAAHAREAHVAGDDPMARWAVGRVLAAHTRAQASAAARSLTDVDAPPMIDQVSLERLKADQLRRAGRTSPPRTLAELAALPVDAQVAGLIGLLDEMRDGMSSWGSVSIRPTDPVVEALIAAGPAAVLPLIDAIEHDRRLSRMLQRGRSINTAKVLGVAPIALQILYGIIDVDLVMSRTETSRLDDDKALRTAVAATLRGHWAKVKGKPVEQTWWDVLSDDTATPQQWLAAAESIARPSDVTVRGHNTMVPLRKAGAPITPRGEALRASLGDAVRIKMVERAQAIESATDLGPGRCLMMKHVVAWDPAATAVFTAYVDELHAGWSALDDNHAMQLVNCLAQLTDQRLLRGDRTAAEDYARWLQDVPRAHVTSPASALSPMLADPTLPAMQRLAEHLFATSTSSWLPLMLPAGKTLPEQDFTDERMLAVPEIRKRIVAELDLQHEVARFEVTADGGAMIRSPWSGGQGPIGPSKPPVGAKGPLRYCDVLATGLIAREGVGDRHPFQWHWSKRRRNAAIKALKTRLVDNTYGVKSPSAPRP